MCTSYQKDSILASPVILLCFLPLPSNQHSSTSPETRQSAPVASVSPLYRCGGLLTGSPASFHSYPMHASLLQIQELNCKTRSPAHIHLSLWRLSRLLIGVKTEVNLLRSPGYFSAVTLKLFSFTVVPAFFLSTSISDSSSIQAVHSQLPVPVCSFFAWLPAFPHSCFASVTACSRSSFSLSQSGPHAALVPLHPVALACFPHSACHYRKSSLCSILFRYKIEFIREKH